MRGILCIICSIELLDIEQVKSARYIVNGHGVCVDHVAAVVPENESGTTVSMLITKPKP